MSTNRTSTTLAPDAILAELDAARAAAEKKLFGKRPRAAAALAEARALAELQLAWRAEADASQRRMSELERLLADGRAELAQLAQQAAARTKGLEAREADLADVEARVSRELTRLHAVEEREKLAAAREAALAERESRAAGVEALLAKNTDLNAAMADHSKRYLEHIQRQEAALVRLQENEARLKQREDNVERWKLDLTHREQALATKHEELHDLERRREEVLEDIGDLKEKRLAEIDQRVRELDAREARLAEREAGLNGQLALLRERSDRLTERKVKLDDHEQRLQAREDDLARLADELRRRDLQVKDLEQQIGGLEHARRELQTSLVKLGAQM